MLFACTSFAPLAAQVLVWCYLYTVAWMIFAEAPCSYWMWLIAFRMTAVSASGVGVFISTLVPKQNPGSRVDICVGEIQVISSPLSRSKEHEPNLAPMNKN